MGRPGGGGRRASAEEKSTGPAPEGAVWTVGCGSFARRPRAEGKQGGDPSREAAAGESAPSPPNPGPARAKFEAGTPRKVWPRQKRTEETTPEARLDSPPTRGSDLGRVHSQTPALAPPPGPPRSRPESSPPPPPAGPGRRDLGPTSRLQGRVDRKPLLRRHG